MSDLLFRKPYVDTLDITFGVLEDDAPSPEEVLGEYDLLFQTAQLEGFDLFFGAVSDGSHEGIAETVGSFLLRLPLPRVSVTATNIRQVLKAAIYMRVSVPQFSLSLAFDINTFRGFSRDASSTFTDSVLIYDKVESRLQEADKTITSFTTRYQEPIPIRGDTVQSLQEGYSISRQTATFFEVGQPVKSYAFATAQVAEPISRRTESLFEQAFTLPAVFSKGGFQVADLVGQILTDSAQVAVPVSRRYGFETKLSQKVNRSFDVFYQLAEYPINVRPPKIKPVKPPLDIYEKAFNHDLVFDCAPSQDETPVYHDIIFNNCWNSSPYLGVDYTEPYFVINSIELINIETGEVIQATAIDFSTDQSSYAWSGTFTVADEELPKLVADSNNPVLVSVTFNGNLAVFMVQSISRAASFNKSSYKVSIISPTALLDSPYSRIDSKTVTEDAAPQTLIEERLTSELTGITLNWQYLSPLDWVVTANTFTYQEMSPIKAIGKLLEGSAAFMSSSLDGTELVVKRKRVNEFWEPAINPKVLESALLTSLSFTREKHRNFDSVYVISGLNQTIGITAHVIRAASAGVELAPQIVAPTLTSPSSARDAGKYALGTAGIVETRTLVQPIVEGAPLLVPADLVSFKLDGTTYIGTVLSTSVSLKFNSQYQNFVVEVVKGYN